MGLERFLALQAEIKGVIGQSFIIAFNKNQADFVLLMARGGYHKHLELYNKDYTPFVLDDKEDFLMDLTRKKFFVKYMNNYIERLKNGNTMSGDELEYEITTQLMIYSHIWESYLFLNQLARLAGIQKGKPYLWITNLQKSNKKNFINRKIINLFKKTDMAMTHQIKHCYSEILRNAFAHSTYYINGGKIHFNKNVIFDGPIVIYMPMKNNHNDRRGVYIKPVPYDGKEEKVKFRYMQKGEI